MSKAERGGKVSGSDANNCLGVLYKAIMEHTEKVRIAGRDVLITVFGMYLRMLMLVRVLVEVESW